MLNRQKKRSPPSSGCYLGGIFCVCMTLISFLATANITYAGSYFKYSPVKFNLKKTFSYYIFSLFVCLNKTFQSASPVMSVEIVFFTGIFLTDAAFVVVENDRHIMNTNARDKDTLSDFKSVFFMLNPSLKNA